MPLSPGGREGPGAAKKRTAPKLAPMHALQGIEGVAESALADDDAERAGRVGAGAVGRRCSTR